MMQHSEKTWVTVAVVAVGGLSLAPAALAQQDTSTRFTGATAFDNLGIATGRTPGGMVSRGVGRALAHADQGFTSVLSPEITETDPIRSVGDQWRIDSIPVVAEELAEIMLCLFDQWLARAGLGRLFADCDAVREAVSASVPGQNGGGSIPDGNSGDGTNGDVNGPTRPQRKQISSR